VKTVFVIDNDLGFLLWLGSALHQAGYNVLPSNGIREATKIIRELKTVVDWVIIDISLDGAAALIDFLRSFNRRIGVLVLLGESEFRSLRAYDEYASIPKPGRIRGFAGFSWLETVKQFITDNSSFA
jgi:DNA-binding NtrC family response regulator